MSRLEEILEYQMDETQAKAFKLSLLWEQLAEKEFPGYPHINLRRNGDPRKSILFRHCFRLVRETKGIIPDEEYKLYMLAQLHVMKYICDNGCARVDPIILVGEKAWRRWKYWKKKYDRKMNQRQTVDDVQVTAPLHAIKRDLERTRKFLSKTFGKTRSFTDISQAVRTMMMTRWVNFDEVSPYYVVMSPWVQKVLDGRDIEEVFCIDMQVYLRSVTPEASEAFRKIFQEEFPS